MDVDALMADAWHEATVAIGRRVQPEDAPLQFAPVAHPDETPAVEAPVQPPTVVPETCAACHRGAIAEVREDVVLDRATMTKRTVTTVTSVDAPILVPDLGVRLHLNCSRCANCRADPVEWLATDADGNKTFAPSCHGSLRKDHNGSRRLLCAACSRFCSCSPGCDIASQAPTEDADWFQPIVGPEQPWIYLPHRPCRECDQPCMHSAKPRRPRPQPLSRCAIGNHCLHSGFLSLRSWNCHLRAKPPVLTPVCFAHLQCLYCKVFAYNEDDEPKPTLWMLTQHGPAHRRCVPCAVCLDAPSADPRLSNKFKKLARDPHAPRSLSSTLNLIFHDPCLTRAKQDPTAIVRSPADQPLVPAPVPTPSQPPANTLAPFLAPVDPFLAPFERPVVEPDACGSTLACGADDEDNGDDDRSHDDAAGASSSEDDESSQDELDDDPHDDPVLPPSPAPPPSPLTPPPPTPVPRRPTTRSSRGRAQAHMAQKRPRTRYDS